MKVAADKACRCGRPKQIGQAVCSQCWGKLPARVKNDLYLERGNGFVKAYRDACQILHNQQEAAEAVTERSRQMGLFR